MTMLKNSWNLEAEVDAMADGELKATIKEWQLLNKDNGGAMNMSGIAYRNNLQHILENLDNAGIMSQVKTSIARKNSPMTKGEAMRAFWDIFHVDIRQYYNGIFGFDVVKFDDVVKPNEHESTSDAIKRQWGSDAVVVIEALF